MEHRSRRVQYLAAVAVSLASAAAGSYTSWPAPVIPKFHDNETDIEITKDEVAWMVAMSAPGFVVGSFVMRFVSDKYGRRATILGSVLPVAIGTILVAVATKAWLLYLTRFLWGIGTGMINTVGGLYFAEIADKDIRGSLIMVIRFMFNFGNLLMMTIGPFVSYKLLNYMLLTIPVIYFIACWWIPESPYYYLKEGKIQAAKKVLQSIRGYTDEKELEDELSQMQSQVKNEMRRSGSAKELFTGKRYRKAVIVSAGLKFAQIFAGQLLIQQYLGLIIKESETDLKNSTALIIFGVVRFVAGVMSSIIADKVGRRTLLTYSFVANAVSLVFVGVYFIIFEFTNVNRELLKPYGYVTFAALIVGNIVSTLGYNSVIQIVPAEIFPLNVKAVAMTSLSIFGGSMNFCVSRGYQAFKDIAGLSGVFWIFTVASVGGAIFSALYVPETKGKSLKDIQIQLQGDLYEKDEILVKLNEISIVPECKELQELLKKDTRQA